MAVAERSLFELDDTFARELEGLHLPWQAAPVAEPSLVALNDALAADLGLDPDELRSPEGIAVLAGNAAPAGVATVAQVYAGHQFGGYSPRLGDGRALLLGEVVDRTGVRRDLHLKGSGPTPFARGGDGRAALGPMLREYLMGEAMHALGIPTTRMLAVVATGETVLREVGGDRARVPGAVLTRVAASHLRVGTFQFAAATGDRNLLSSLVAYAIERHAPHAAADENPALALYDHVVTAQANLVAQWMQVGFIHGVMNTDNVTISGETIDYGPCAFMEGYDPATVFSSIDHGGRYAYGNQPAIATWNLARLAEAMLPAFGGDDDVAVERATAVLQQFPERFQSAWARGMRSKIGLDPTDDAGDRFVADLLALLQANSIDYTRGVRGLSAVLRGDDPAAVASYGDGFERWTADWRPNVAATPDELDRRNPLYIPRNHLVEEALSAATDGDLTLFEHLLAVVDDPFTERPGAGRYAEPAPPEATACYRTYCGT
jgi:serine/tyrosine/threonine adenylyltransferase